MLALVSNVASDGIYGRDEISASQSDSVHTIKEVAYIVGMAPQSVSNFFHNLIKARGTLKYVALFKGWVLDLSGLVTMESGD